MKKELGPSWTKQQKAAGEKQRQAWEEFFSKSATEQETPFSPAPENVNMAQARARHEAKLMRYPNVVGVATGIRVKGGKPTGEPCVVVFVQKKVARDKLKNDELIPGKIDDVPVDVVEVGKIEPLS